MPHLVRPSDGYIVATDAELAATWRRRAIGYLGRAAIPSGSALILAPCRAIHTWGMRIPIAAVFIDRDWRVVRIFTRVPPWRMINGGRRAWGVVELAADAESAFRLTPGDRLEFTA
mgnify:CR=1 FL=1